VGVIVYLLGIGVPNSEVGGLRGTIATPSSDQLDHGATLLKRGSLRRSRKSSTTSKYAHWFGLSAVGRMLQMVAMSGALGDTALDRGLSTDFTRVSSNRGQGDWRVNRPRSPTFY